MKFAKSLVMDAWFLTFAYIALVCGLLTLARVFAITGMRSAPFAIAGHYSQVKPLIPSAALSSPATPDLQILLQKAQAGDAEAQNQLGLAYLRGTGTPKDPKESFRWLLAAAQQGLPAAQYNLAELYDHGLGTPNDIGEALKWFRKAADQGQPKAREFLAKTAADLERFAQAAEQGDNHAANRLTIFYFKSGDYASAMKWARLAADRGDAAAAFNIGGFYEYGRGTPVDRNAAMSWYRKAAAGGNKEGQAALQRLGDR